MTPVEIRALRVGLDLTQADLARLFGVSRATIIRAEAGDAVTPPVTALYRLLNRFGAEAVAVMERPATSTDPAPHR